MTEKAKNTSASADDEVEIIDEGEDETEVVDDAAAPEKAKAKADRADTDGDDEAGDDDEPPDRAEIEQKRKIQAQKRARAAERRADALEKRLAELEQNVGSADLARNREAATRRLKAAEQAHDAAYEDGDPAKIREALKELRAAETEAAENEKAAKQVRQPTRPAVSVNPHRDSFIEKYDDWFDPNGSDRDSGIVKALSAALIKEGVDPTTKEHFTRLEKDMRQYLPHRFKAPAPAKQTSASSSGSRRSDAEERPGKVTIHGMTIKAFKDNFGLDWHDPDPEKRKIARERIIQRQREVQAARGAA